MGCDIHAHIELKLNGKWEHYSCPQLKRRYKLFERICGVRGEISNAIAPPRGLPKDISEITKIIREWDGIDGHSDTYLTKIELNALIEWMEKDTPHWQHEELGYLTGNTFLQYLGSNPPQFTDVRFICWFDN